MGMFDDVTASHNCPGDDSMFGLARDAAQKRFEAEKDGWLTEWKANR